jgi:chromosome segregation ATPase
LSRLRNAVVKSSRLSTQLSALHDLVETKNKIIKDMKHKLAGAKQTNQTLTRELSIGRDVDVLLSTNSLDRSLRRASERILSTPGSSLEDAAKLLFEKEKIISSLRSKLVAAEKSQGNLLQEADRMKADIQTLVARLEEAEGVECEIEMYKSSCIELNNAVDDGKKEVAGLKEKLRRVSKASKDNEAKIEELKESLIRAKRVLSVQRQGRSRSEHNLKTSTDTIASLKEQIEKMETQIDRARDEKLKANNKVRRLSSMLQTATTSTSDNKIDEEAVKSAEEQQKRIDVQNKTIAGLASQNSKLRSELARAKMAKTKQDADKEEECTQCKNLESKVTLLEQSLSKEKKDLSTTQSKLERCKKKALSLEQQIADLHAEVGKRGAAEANDVANDSLQAEISALREKNESLLLAMKDNNFDTLKLLRAENFQLKKENERLLKVDHDHLSLIERIEELTIRYNDAVMQLNQLSMR